MSHPLFVRIAAEAVPETMSQRHEQTATEGSSSGFFFAAMLALLIGSFVFLLIPPVGLALLLFWILPSLVHAWTSIARQSRYFPLPWEDQFAAVIVSFIMQIPLWLTAGFVGFLLGAVVFDLLVGGPEVRLDKGPLEVAGYIVVWFVSTIGIYLTLYLATLIWPVYAIYHDDPADKTTSIRDAKPIYHPF